MLFRRHAAPDKGVASMKNPLHYQLSEYDCGPTSMLNAMSFLFSREEIPPEIVRIRMRKSPSKA